MEELKKFLEGKIGENLHDFGLINELLDPILKVRSKKSSINDKWDSLKLITFVFQENEKLSQRLGKKYLQIIHFIRDV